ncbi:MAG: efflux RND transporter periplasmic adaptor subunit [Candidatus Accumulibacter sp.]|nr:efflux RND transporter periplasmic adaptor subunit [Accumulibacter sp.]
MNSGRVAVAMVLASLGACGEDAAPPVQPALVRTVVVGAGSEAANRFTGTVRARIESDLSFRVPGKVTARLVDAGARVSRGQRLATLDPSDLALAANAASGEAAAARAEAVRAQAELRRLAPLAARGFVSARNLDVARADAAAAAARLRASEAQARSAGNQSRYAALVADADGVVMSISAEAGQVVTAGMPVVRLARSGPRDVLVALPETARPIAGAPAQVQLYGDGRVLPARLHSLSAAADPATRTFEARYAVPGGDALPLGATATVTIAKAGAQRLTVPLGALHDGGEGQGVWVVGRDSRVRFRRVSIAALGEENATIASGLRAGERVIALGAHLLQPGQRVRSVAARPAQ